MKKVTPLVAALLLMGAVGMPALAAEYRDPKGVFTLSYDEAIWTFAPDADGDLDIKCTPQACQGVTTGCSVSRIWVPFGTIKRLTDSFDAKNIERTLIEVLAKHKATSDKETAERGPDAVEVEPTLIVPHHLRYTRGGAHPIHEAELRVSFAGVANRFLSISTAARSYSLASVCYVREDQLALWRPRFDALIEGFQPGAAPFWLRWMERLGL